MSTAFTDATRPMHEVGEEERFTTDFFAYLEQPENASRYTPAVDWIRYRFGDRFRLLDLGCGTAPLLRYLPRDTIYCGVDHSANAIDICRHRHPRAEFVHDDIERALEGFATGGRRFDAIVLCGVLNHMVDKDNLAPKDDQAVIRACVERALEPHGALAIIVGVPFRRDSTFSFRRQAEWKRSLVNKALEGLPMYQAHDMLTIQVGLESRIRRQKQLPDWFIPNEHDATPNRHTGSRIGALTVIATRSDTLHRGTR